MAGTRPAISRRRSCTRRIGASSRARCMAVKVSDDFLLFKRAVELSLWETLESFFGRHVAAVERGDVALIAHQQEMLRLAVISGNVAVVAAREKLDGT